MENVHVCNTDCGDVIISTPIITVYYSRAKIEMIEYAYQCGFLKYISTITIEQLIHDALNETHGMVLINNEGSPREVIAFSINKN